MQWQVDCEARQCPRLLITDDSRAMVDRYLAAVRMREATGGVYYGPDSSLWPARWVDIVNLLSYEISLEEAAREQAFANWRSSQGR